MVQVKLPSSEVRNFRESCFVTIGQVGNGEHMKKIGFEAYLNKPNVILSDGDSRLCTARTNNPTDKTTNNLMNPQVNPTP